MNITILLPLLVCVIGVVLHALPVGGATLKVLATAMIYGGVFVTLLVLSPHMVRLG